MKKLVFVLSVFAVLFGSAEPKKMSLREKIAERHAKAGGMIEAPVTGQRVFVVNKQSRVKAAAISEIVAKIRDVAKLPIEMNDNVSGDISSRIDAKEGAVILLVDDAVSPSVLVAPENAWCSINVGMLAKDEPTERRLKARTEKEMWRGLCMALGASNAIFQPCLMRTIRSLKDLDYCSNEIPSPEPLGKLEDAAKEFGIMRLRSVTYKTACFEGWAPAPTNDVQKAIYDGVKDGSIKPSTPKK